MDKYDVCRLDVSIIRSFFSIPIPMKFGNIFLEFRPIHSEIIRKNLVTYFMEASSLPVNVSIIMSYKPSK